MKWTQLAQYQADQADPELSKEVSEEHDEADEPELIQKRRGASMSQKKHFPENQS